MTVLKLILKIVIAPVILLLTLAIWICVGLVYVLSSINIANTDR